MTFADVEIPFGEWAERQSCTECGIGLPLALLAVPLRPERFCSERCRGKSERRKERWKAIQA